MRRAGEPVALADELDRQVGLARGDVALQQVVAQIVAVRLLREREHALEVLRDDDRRVAGDALEAVRAEVADERSESLQLEQRRLRPSRRGR